jgi:kumamolisin
VHDTVNKPSVISISWGGPEDSWTQQSADAMLQAVTDAAAVGVTVTAAAGDDGATDGVSDNKLHVDLPACLPPVLACGGTRLNTSNGVLTSEVVWNELASQEGATGGGVSKIFPIPSYQASAGVPKQPETNFAGRGVPDVAGDADPVTGYAVRVDGKNTVIGGTSAVAPLWAGLTALINQQLGRPLGFMQPVIYQIGESAFRDITSGNNGGYSAGVGWDPCTGLGIPNGTALVNALMGRAVASGVA